MDILERLTVIEWAQMMEIDITKLKLKDAELLRMLGDDAWVIKLPSSYPSVTIEAAWRERIRAEVAMKFVRWVIDGKFVEIDQDDDPPWDRSGSAKQYEADPLELLTHYDSLAAWLAEEYTGNSRATYEPGAGLYWETFGDDMHDFVDEQVFERIKVHLQFALGYEDDAATWEDRWIDLSDEIIEVQTIIANLLMVQIEQVTTKEAWETFENTVRAQLEEELQEAIERAAHYSALREMIRAFWDVHFADIDGKRIEKPEFTALKLADRLRELFLDADPDLVEAVAELGLPGMFSNSVAIQIQYLARQALE
jgi:hypothetical protein